VRQLFKSSITSTQEPTPFSPWIKPQLRKLAAGAAESAGHAGNDGVSALS
jgi:hypothetical protein